MGTERRAGVSRISWPDDEILHSRAKGRNGHPPLCRERAFLLLFERMRRFVDFLLFPVNEPVA